MKIFKNTLFIILLIFSILSTSTVFVQNTYSASKGAIGCTSLTGEDYSLDKVPPSIYLNDMLAIVPINNDLMYFYIYDETCVLPESLPDIVVPDSNLSGVGAWKRTRADSEIKDVTAEGLFVRSLQGWVEIQQPESGVDGQDGTIWLAGTVAPEDTIGKDNDFYYDYIASDVYRKNTPTYDEGDLCIGGTAEAETENGTAVVSRAFDNSVVVYYESTVTNAEIKYDFGVGVSHPVAKIRVYRRTGDMKNISVSGSNDNEDWNVLTTKLISNVDHDDWVDIEFFNNKVYRYIKFIVLDVYTTDTVLIYEMEMYSADRYSWNLISNIKGEDGDPGTPGTPGTNGIDGKTWFSGLIAPEANVGVVGDYYINTVLFDIYHKTAVDTWTLVGNIKSTDGDDGIDGAKWYTGADTPPPVDTGVDGDFYLNTTTYYLYKKVTGAWVSLGCIKGTDGIGGGSEVLDLGELGLSGSILTTPSDILNKSIIFSIPSSFNTSTSGSSPIIKANDCNLLVNNRNVFKILTGYKYSGISNESIMNVNGYDFLADKDFENLSITNFTTKYGSVVKHVLNTIALNGGNSGCSDIITPNGDYPGGAAFNGGVLLPDGRVFCVPYYSATARIYDPITDTLITPSGTYPENSAFVGGVLLPDGRVFCVPYSSTTARIYDPITDTLTTPSGDYPGGAAFNGGVLLPDGRVFLVPYYSETARIYDPITNTLITPSGTYPDIYSFTGGVLLPDGRVFLVPSNSTSARIYDPITDILTTPSGTYPGSGSFLGGVLLPDGRVFLVPRNSTSACIYDPITDTLSIPSGTYPGSSAFTGGVLLPDGRVFCVPYSSTTARIYDPITDTLITPSGTYPGSAFFRGGMLLPDGRVFCVPYYSTTALITTPAPTYKFDLPVILGPTYNKF